MTRGSRCRARQFRRPVCWRTSSTTATGTALVRTPSVTCSLSCRPSTRQQPFWPMAAHSIPRAPPVLPFQQNLLLVQHLWISILCKTLLNGIDFNPDKGFSDCGFELIAGQKVALGLDRVDLVGGDGRDDVNEGVDDGSMLGQIEG